MSERDAFVKITFLEFCTVKILPRVDDLGDDKFPSPGVPGENIWFPGTTRSKSGAQIPSKARGRSAMRARTRDVTGIAGPGCYARVQQSLPRRNRVLKHLPYSMFMK